MKTALAIASAALCSLALSCGGGGSARAGTYSVDTDAMLEAVMGEVPEEVKAMAREAMAGMRIEITLNGDNTYSGVFSTLAMPGAEAGETTARGTWEMSGDKLTLRQTHENGQEATDVHTATFVGDSEFHMADEDGQMLVMKKG